MGPIGTIATITPLRIIITITCITIAAEPAETAKRNWPAQAGLFCGTRVGHFRRLIQTGSGPARPYRSTANLGTSATVVA
jgi:hypothetical protein